MSLIAIWEDDPDQGAQRVAPLGTEDGGEEGAKDGEAGELEGEKGERGEEEEEEEEEEDLEPLPPGRHQRRSGGIGEERGGSSLTLPGTQIQGRAASQTTLARAASSSLGRPSRDNLSSEASRDLDHRGEVSWAVGGSQVQRRVTSALGRRYRDNLSSEASRDSGVRDKRLCVESSRTAEVPSSPPCTPRVQSSLSQNSEATSGASGKRVSRKYLTREFVPSCNINVFDLAKQLLQAEVLACHPWPNTSTIEVLVRQSWSKAFRIREQERRKVYPGAGHVGNELLPTKEPDEISLEIVSTH